jgi:hypothetical protein
MASSNSSLTVKSCACTYIKFLAGIFSWSVDCTYLLIPLQADKYIYPPVPSNEPSPWSRCLIEKLIVIQLVNKLPASYVTQTFTTNSHNSTTGPFLDPVESSSHPPILSLIFILKNPPIYDQVFQVVSSLQIFQARFCMYFSCVSCLLFPHLVIAATVISSLI